MKKFLLTALVAAATITTAFADGRERPVTLNELPQTARTFLSAHFGGKTLAYAVAEQKYAGDEYEVVYSDRVTVYFRPDGEWKSVSSKYGAVPDAIVPRQIKDYVASGNFSGQQVREINRGSHSWEIELSSGSEVKFDLNFKVLDIDMEHGHDNDRERAATLSELPQTARTFLSAHFSGKTVAYVVAEQKRAGTEYDVVYTDRTSVEFSPDGEWKSVSSEYGAVPDTIVPRQIKDFVASGNFSDRQVRQIERGLVGWEITLSRGLEVKFDQNFTVLDYDD